MMKDQIGHGGSFQRMAGMRAQNFTRGPAQKFSLGAAPKLGTLTLVGGRGPRPCVSAARLERNHAARATARVGRVAPVSRNHMNVRVPDPLRLPPITPCHSSNKPSPWSADIRQLMPVALLQYLFLDGVDVQLFDVAKQVLPDRVEAETAVDHFVGGLTPGPAF